MEYNDQLEKNFLDAIQKTHCKRTYEEEVKLNQRNKAIMLRFPGTLRTDKKLELLNQTLKSEEKRIFPIFRQIESQCAALVLNKDIDDFEIEIVLECWNNDYYEKYDNSIEGNPFFETVCGFMAFQQGELYEDEDWREPFDNGILAEEQHCYSFHHLYEHTDLTWFDLCNIDEIWFELKVVYQYFSEVR